MIYKICANIFKQVGIVRLENRLVFSYFDVFISFVFRIIYIVIFKFFKYQTKFLFNKNLSNISVASPTPKKTLYSK